MARRYADELTKDDLQKLQKVLLRILDDFSEVCKEHELTYYLDGGTLLGAIRHQGFIPWDDDIDVVMPRTDYEKLIQIMQKDDRSPFYLQTFHSDPSYWNIYGKYRLKGTEYADRSTCHLNCDQTIAIDVFPLDQAYSMTSPAVWLRWKALKLTDFMIKIKMHVGSRHNRIDRRIYRLLALPFPLKMLVSLREKIAAIDRKKRCRYLIQFGSSYSFKKAIFPKEQYENIQSAIFEKKNFSVPAEWHQILSCVYGDYMQLPPVEKRKPPHRPVYMDLGES
ncbi:MAG: LicD family protein [Lachnospiraceae bacterium]|nr:LicD family protein [Lachnospiraceae bacterium]